MIPNLSKDMIDIMQQLRKRLRSEFNSDVKLSQPDVIQFLLELVNQSRDQKTQLLFADLEDMMGLELRHKPIDEAQNKSVTGTYRGNTFNIKDEVGLPINAKKQITSRTRIYRGQVVA